MTDRLTRGPGGTWVRVRNVEAVIAGRAARPASGAGVDVVPGAPYQISITQRDPPNHSVICTLHDRAPTPTEGGGGWEEVTLPKRGAVLIWRQRSLMKMSLSVVFDDFINDGSVIDSTYTTLLRFWRPEGTGAADDSTVEPSVLRLNARGDVVPYRNLSWVISGLEWGAGQGNALGARTQQVLMLTFTEYRADERLRPAHVSKARTKRYTWRKGDTLKKVAERHHTTAAKLGAMQKPPIKDGRKIKVGQHIVVPA